MILISGDVTQITSGVSDEYNITKSDLEFSPDISNPVKNDINLHSPRQSENINFTESNNMTSPDFNSDAVIKLDNESDSGNAVYRVNSDTQVITTETSSYFFDSSSSITLEEYETADTDETAIQETQLNDRQNIQLNENTNFINFKISPSTDAVYTATEKNGIEDGTLEKINKWIDSIGTALSSWFVLFSGLPDVLSWLGIMLSMIATIVVVLIIAW